MEKTKMNRTLVTIQIVSALTWAAVIVGCSYVLKDTGSNEQISSILIAGASTHILLLSSVCTGIFTVNKNATGQQ